MQAIKTSLKNSPHMPPSGPSTCTIARGLSCHCTHWTSTS